MRQRREVRQCLQDALTPGRHPEAWSRLGPLDLEALPHVAVLHGVEGWVRQRAGSLGVNLPALGAAVHGALARYQLALEDLKLVTDALGAIDRDFLIIKGPALVERFYAGPELRSSVDLDVLVRPRDLSGVLAALERAGCTLLDANWPLLARLQVGELRVQGPSGGLVDLHWSLGKQPAAADLTPPAETLLERNSEITIAGVTVRTLDWADTVVHLAAHAADSGGDRLMWYADLRAVLDETPPGGIDQVLQRAAEWGAGPALQLMLLRGRRAIDLEAPGLLEGLTEGGPGIAWAALVRAADRMKPVGVAEPGRPALGRLVARSTRRNATASWRALAAKSLHTVRPGRRLTPDSLRDPEDPRSGLFPAGGWAGREAFLQQVSSDSVSPRRTG